MATFVSSSEVCVIVRGIVYVVVIVKMQNIYNLISWNSMRISDFMIAAVQIPMKCETHERYAGNEKAFGFLLS